MSFSIKVLYENKNQESRTIHKHKLKTKCIFIFIVIVPTLQQSQNCTFRSSGGSLSFSRDENKSFPVYNHHTAPLICPWHTRHHFSSAHAKWLLSHQMDETGCNLKAIAGHFLWFALNPVVCETSFRSLDIWREGEILVMMAGVLEWFSVWLIEYFLKALIWYMCVFLCGTVGDETCEAGTERVWDGEVSIDFIDW